MHLTLASRGKWRKGLRFLFAAGGLFFVCFLATALFIEINDRSGI